MSQFDVILYNFMFYSVVFFHRASASLMVINCGKIGLLICDFSRLFRLFRLFIKVDGSFGEVGSSLFFSDLIIFH